MVEIKVNCKNHNMPYSKKGGWFDIPLPEDIYVKPYMVLKITFDLRVKMPEGYEAIIQPRSSTLERWGLLSSGFGVIEDSYCGKDDYIGYRFFALNGVKIPKGTCLVQMRFQEKMKDFKLVKVSSVEFNGKNRGGFGSTDESFFSKIERRATNTEYLSGFTAGYNEGEQDGYDKGFVKGYDQAITDMKGKLIGD